MNPQTSTYVTRLLRQQPAMPATTYHPQPSSSFTYYREHSIPYLFFRVFSSFSPLSFTEPLTPRDRYVMMIPVCTYFQCDDAAL